MIEVMSATPTVELKFGLNFPALTAAYCIWKAEGTFESIFFRNPSMGLWDFLGWNYQPTAEPVGCYIGDKMVGIGWICQAWKIDGQVVAEVGAAFFKDTPLSVWHRAIDLFVHHAFAVRGFDAIYGISSAQNAQAQLIVRRCGMTPASSLPWGEGIPPGAVANKMDRRDWEQGVYRRAS